MILSEIYCWKNENVVLEISVQICFKSKADHFVMFKQNQSSCLKPFPETRLRFHSYLFPVL